MTVSKSRKKVRVCVRVEGANEDVQSWRYHGGTGSSASTIVKVR